MIEAVRSPSASGLSGRPPARTHTPLLAAVLAELDEGDETLKRELASRLRPYLGDDPGRLLDADEKAAQLGLHRDTLVRMSRDGRVPGARKVGREWRYPADRSEILPIAGGASTASAPASARRAATIRRASVAAIRGHS